MVEKLVTYLEVTDPAQLRPAAGIVGLALVHLDRASSEAARIRRLHDAIATPHLWSSLDRSDGGWRRSLAEPTRSHWIAVVDGTDVGWASLVRPPSGTDRSPRVLPALGFEDSSDVSARYLERLHDR